MTIIIRTGDFNIAGGQLFVGPRILSVNAIISHNLWARISVELLGFSLAALASFTGASMTHAVGASLSLMALGGLLIAGAVREFVRRYVLAIQLYQLGPLEVCGFNRAEAEHLQAVLTGMNRRRLTNNGRSAVSREAGLSRIFNLQKWRAQ